MFEGILQPTHLLLIFAIVMLVFGPKKLPELGKGLGEAIRGFKASMNGDGADEATPPKTLPDADANRGAGERRG